MVATLADIKHQNKAHTFFSWAVQAQVNPVVVESAKGVYLHSKDGKRWLDFSSQLMNVNIGHGRPEVTEAVMKQMEKFSFVSPSFATEARGQLGEKLKEITPGDLSKTFFTLGGAEAIENAIKLKTHTVIAALGTATRQKNVVTGLPKIWKMLFSLKDRKILQPF